MLGVGTNKLLGILFFKEVEQVTNALAEEKWRRTRLYMFVTSALVSIWGIFDFVIDFENVWFFIALRAIYTPITLWVAFNFHKPYFKARMMFWAQLHYVFLIIDIGVMVIWTDHFVKYLIGFSTIFWGASVIMVWRFWHTVIPGLVVIAIASIRFIFFPHNVAFTELITGGYYFVTCLTFTSIISAYVYYSAYELTRSQLALKHANEKLVQSEKMQSLNVIVSSVAHELNNPIGVTRTACSDAISKLNTLKSNLIKDDITLDMLEDPAKDAQDSLRMGMKAIDRAANMVSRFKQTAIDQTDGREREEDLKEYIQQHVINLGMRRIIENSGVNIEVRSTGNMRIMTKPGALSQIFTNLISNAIHHGFANTKIDNKKIIITLKNDGEKMSIEVKDNGSGIQKDIQKKIFEPCFSTVEKGNTQDVGVGLGLSIIYEIVTQTLHGEITVHSEYGQGAAFIITFPLLKAVA